MEMIGTRKHGSQTQEEDGRGWHGRAVIVTPRAFVMIRAVLAVPLSLPILPAVLVSSRDNDRAIAHLHFLFDGKMVPPSSLARTHPDQKHPPITLPSPQAVICDLPVDETWHHLRFQI